MAKLEMLKNVRERSGTKDSRSVSLTVKDIPIGDISVKGNVRTEYSGLEELSASIKQYGLLQPITVYAEGGGFTVKAGHRRYMAYKMLYKQEPERFHSIRCIVSDAYNTVVIQLIENVQRVDLSQIDLFNALSSLREQGMTLRQIADVMGKSEGYIKNLFVGINEIGRNEELQAYIGSHAGVTIQDIAETSTIPDKQERLNLLEERKRETISRSDLRQRARELKSPKSEEDFEPIPIVERTKISMKLCESSREIILAADEAVSDGQFLAIGEDVRKFFVLHDNYDLEIARKDT